MATVLASLLTDIPVRPLTAMTGEITLSGNVLPVGGIKEKFLAARRAGVETIILPADNRQDVEEDLTPEMIEGVTIHYASRIEDVLAVALPLAEGKAGSHADCRGTRNFCRRIMDAPLHSAAIETERPANLPAFFISPMTYHLERPGSKNSQFCSSRAT